MVTCNDSVFVAFCLRPQGSVMYSYLGKDSVDGIATLSDHEIPVEYDVKGKSFAEGIWADA